MTEEKTPVEEKLDLVIHMLDVVIGMQAGLIDRRQYKTALLEQREAATEARKQAIADAAEAEMARLEAEDGD